MKTTVGERGVALVLSLWMLVILGLLGTMLLAASNVEIRLAANNRDSQVALYTADCGVQYGRSDPAIYTTIGPGTGFFPGTSPPGTYALSNLPICANTAQNVTVKHLTIAPPPEGSGIDANLFQAQYLSVQATGVGRNSSTVLLESQIGRPIPK